VTYNSCHVVLWGERESDVFDSPMARLRVKGTQNSWSLSAF
jgi:hypothetical protein